MLLVFAELSTHFCMEKWAISTTWSDHIIGGHEIGIKISPVSFAVEVIWIA